MVESERSPEQARTMRFPAKVETTVEGAYKYGEACCATAILLTGILKSAVLSDDLRKKCVKLRDQQRALGEVFADALTAASGEMKAKEAALSELPVVSQPMSASHNRPAATACFAVCEGVGCGNPLREAQATGSLKRRGNRLCVECERQLDVSGTGTRELPLEGTETSETPQAFR